MTEERNRYVSMYLSVLSLAFVGIAVFILGTYYFFQNRAIPSPAIYNAEASVIDVSNFKEEDGYIVTSRNIFKIPNGFSIDGKYLEPTPAGFHCVYTDAQCFVYDIISPKGTRFYVSSNAPIYLDLDMRLPQVPVQLGRLSFSRSVDGSAAVSVRGCYSEDFCLHSGNIQELEYDESEGIEVLSQFLDNIEVIEL